MAYKNIKSIILNSSCNLFAEKGYDNVSVNEICSICSITKPTFYYHFKSKEDILFTRFEASVEDIISSVSSLDTYTTEYDNVLAVFDIIYDAYVELGYDFIQNLLIGSMKNIEHIIYFPDELSKLIILHIKNGQKDGSVSKSCEPEQLFEVCRHIFNGYILFWCQHNGITNSSSSLGEVLAPVLSP